MKMKRKDVDEVSNDFSNFSLSPATKIRRLDGELSPIMELEEEPRMDMGLNPFQVQSAVEVTEPSSSTVMMMPEPEPLNNEERALVLYKPVNATLWQSPDVSITVNQDLFPNFKNGIFWRGHSDCVRSAGDEPDFKFKDKKDGTNDCLAVVPWVSYQLPFSSGGDGPTMTELSEPMEGEDAEEGTMEVEESVDTRAYEGLQHWQQQHCMTPQVPPSTAATPIMWSW